MRRSTLNSRQFDWREIMTGEDGRIKGKKQDATLVEMYREIRHMNVDVGIREQGGVISLRTRTLVEVQHLIPEDDHTSVHRDVSVF
jgi:hypothetical protein